MSRKLYQHETVATHGEASLVAYVVTYVALMGLLGATVAVAFVPLGAFNVPAAMTIATIKASLVLWYFMHLRSSPKLVLLFLIAALAMLVVGAVLTFADYVTRARYLQSSGARRCPRKARSKSVR